MQRFSLLVLLSSVYVDSCYTNQPFPTPISPIDIVAFRSNLRYPNLVKVTWKPGNKNQVRSDYPLTGYKVSLWVDDQQNNKRKRTWIQEDDFLRDAARDIPKSEPMTKIVDPDVHSAIFVVKPTLAYQARVQAFNDFVMGPYSRPVTISPQENDNVET